MTLGRGPALLPFSSSPLLGRCYSEGGGERGTLRGSGAGSSTEERGGPRREEGKRGGSLQYVGLGNGEKTGCGQKEKREPQKREGGGERGKGGRRYYKEE